jgi:hypothetical protein
MKRIILILVLVTFSVLTYSQEPMKVACDIAKVKIDSLEKCIKIEKSEIKRHQKSLKEYQVEVARLKKVVKSIKKL